MNFFSYFMKIIANFIQMAGMLLAKPYHNSSFYYGSPGRDRDPDSLDYNGFRGTIADSRVGSLGRPLYDSRGRYGRYDGYGGSLERYRHGAFNY